MARSGTFAAIDVGTTKICTVVGDEQPDGTTRILGVGLAPSAGLSRGMVDNIRDATEAIRISVEQAERSSGTRILCAHVGIAGSHITSMNNRGVVAVPSQTRPIAEDDVTRVIDGARTVSIPTNRDVLHVIPRYYVVDGQDNVTDPIGMYGQRLDVEAHVITAAVSAMQNLTRCVEGIGVQVDALILEPLASAEAVLEDEERRQGVVLADIGGGTTDVAVYVDGAVYHTSVLPVGGYHLTHDLVVGLRAPFAAAEYVKATYGQALPSAVPADEQVEIEAFGGERQRTFSRRRICEILQARCEEIFEMILVEVKRAGYDEIISAGLVLTGGTANLAGIDALAEQVLDMPARIGVPQNIQGLTETVTNPACATSVGLLEWAIRDSRHLLRPSIPHPPLHIGSLWKRFGELARVVLPE
ncbi:MAG TPA: cell division protein FtsA [Dehalococcoidia bacterium]|nr:cell division protein FtsA [Dehalococcoidia bacterium]